MTSSSTIMIRPRLMVASQVCRASAPPRSRRLHPVLHGGVREPYCELGSHRPSRDVHFAAQLLHGQLLHQAQPQTMALLWGRLCGHTPAIIADRNFHEAVDRSGVNINLTSLDVGER